jgi:sensor histidine kinase YesM
MLTDHVTSFLKYYGNSRPMLVDLVYTIIMWTAITAFLCITGLRKPFWTCLMVCQSIGISIFLTWRASILLAKPRGLLSWMLVAVASAILGTTIGYLVAGFFIYQAYSRVLKPDFMIMITFGAVICSVAYLKYRLEATRETVQQERIRRVTSEKETLEANLRLLQAQIEPHFLFNTLSNVMSLIETNPGKARLMLGDFIKYFRTSLSRTLPTITTLEQELNIIRAYLNIQKIRMSERLRFVIDLPDDLRKCPLPPMLIQPLVENAVKHGLEPRIEGGEIAIRTCEEGGLLRIEVVDTGNGFISCHEPGVGIENVRQRIGLLYGDKGRLTLEENTPNGVRAIVEVPTHGL